MTNGRDAQDFGPFRGKLNRLSPFRGELRLVDAAAWLVRQFGNTETESELWPESKFSVNLHDRIHRQMWAGRYEPHVTRCLGALLQKGDTFLDVGAHIGYLSVFAAGVVGEEGRVFSLEPDPGNFERLEKNLRAFQQARAFPFAGWSESAVLRFERSSVPNESGWGTLATVRDMGQGEHVTVRAVPLDELADEFKMDKVRAIKLDAEGSETAVIRGAAKLLQKARPVLLLEVNGVMLNQAGSSPAALGEELLQGGFEMFELNGGQVRRFEATADCEFADCLCIPKELTRTVFDAMRKNGIETC